MDENGCLVIATMCNAVVEVSESFKRVTGNEN